jgi:hypothetical protein
MLRSEWVFPFVFYYVGNEDVSLQKPDFNIETFPAKEN